MGHTPIEELHHSGRHILTLQKWTQRHQAKLVRCVHTFNCVVSVSPDLGEGRAPEHAPHLDALAPVGHVVLPGHVLLHRLVLVLEAGAGARLDHLGRKRQNYIKVWREMCIPAAFPHK